MTQSIKHIHKLADTQTHKHKRTYSETLTCYPAVVLPLWHQREEDKNGQLYWRINDDVLTETQVLVPNSFLLVKTKWPLNILTVIDVVLNFRLN